MVGVAVDTVDACMLGVRTRVMELIALGVAAQVITRSLPETAAVSALPIAASSALAMVAMVDESASSVAM